MASSCGFLNGSIKLAQRDGVQIDPSAGLPADALVVAAGAHAGHELDFTIDDTNERASRFDVLVHQPGRNVVLVLGAYSPAIWNIKWSRDTRIAGVWVSGSRAAKITGLEADTPLLLSSRGSHGPCPYFYFEGGDSRSMEQQVASVLPRGVDKVIQAIDGRVYVGHTEQTPYYVQGEVRAIDDFRDRELPLAGRKGLEQLMMAGKIRRATMGDMNDYHVARSGPASVSSVAPEFRKMLQPKTYVILGPMIYPPALNGQDAVTFILPKGVPMPRGNRGQSTLLDMWP